MNYSADELQSFSELVTALDNIRRRHPHFAAEVVVLCGLDDDKLPPDPTGVKVWYSTSQPGHLLRFMGDAA